MTKKIKSKEISKKSNCRVSVSFLKLLKNHCTSLELPVYTAKTQTVISDGKIPITKAKTSASFTNIHCIHAPVVELPTPSYACHKKTSTLSSTTFEVRTREYSESSLNLRISVGTPKQKTRLNALTQCICIESMLDVCF